MEQQKYISYLKVIGIILVVFAHSFHEWDGVFDDTVLYRIFMVMRMPLFTFTSGYTLAFCFMARPSHRNYREFVINKAWRLLLPFFVLNTVTFIPRIFFNSIAEDVVSFSVNDYVTNLFEYGKATILYTWFLQMSFICMLICYPIILFTKRTFSRNILLTILLAVTFYLHLSHSLQSFRAFSINQVGNLSVFFVIGIICGLHYKNFISKIPWANPSLLFSLATGWIGIFFINENIESGGTLLLFLSSIFSIMTAISIALMLEKHKITILDHLSGSTYMIFLLSWYVNVASQQVLHHFLPMPWWVHTTLSWVGGIYVPVLVHRFLNHHKERHTYKRTILFLLGHK